MKNEQNPPLKQTAFPWLLLITVTLAPFIAWAQARSWQFNTLTALSLFPLLGLWAWSIMWTHYAYGTLILCNPSRFKKSQAYSRVSRYAVLALILFHPNLLVWNQWNIRGILPPESIYGYVDSSLKVFVFFGTLSFLTFLSFEIFERLRNKAWVQRQWRWISLSQMVAMVLIFFHALAIGQTTNTTWFEYYWVLLGCLLIPCFGVIGRADWQTTKKPDRS